MGTIPPIETTQAVIALAGIVLSAWYLYTVSLDNQRVSETDGVTPSLILTGRIRTRRGWIRFTKWLLILTGSAAVGVYRLDHQDMPYLWAGITRNMTIIGIELLMFRELVDAYRDRWHVNALLESERSTNNEMAREILRLRRELQARAARDAVKEIGGRAE